MTKKLTNLLEVSRLDHIGEVGHDPGRHIDFRQHIHLQVWGERVWQPHVSREGAQNEVAHLDAVGWNDVTEGVVEVAEEFREVMKED